jgi:hypothetical protein
MIKILVPFADPDLVWGAQHFRVGAVAPAVVLAGDAGPPPPLADLGRADMLYILAHGRESSGSEIAGVVPGRAWGTRIAYMTAPELAALLVRKGLRRDFGDLRLMVCWGGYVGGNDAIQQGRGRPPETLRRNAGQAPFAGQLCGALKGLGFTRIQVTGYRGQISYISSTGFTKDSTLSNLGNTLNDGRLTMSELGAANRLAPTGTMQLGGEARRTLSLDNDSRTVWY